jgi:threonine dehydrogenase-like Zn-dependent dehydrogenase
MVPAGASIAIDTTGVPSIIEQSVQSTHARGKVVFIGIPPLGYTLNINLSEHLNVGSFLALQGLFDMQLADCDL